jgi:hypothetical protein
MSYKSSYLRVYVCIEWGSFFTKQKDSSMMKKRCDQNEQKEKRRTNAVQVIHQMQINE